MGEGLHLDHTDGTGRFWEDPGARERVERRPSRSTRQRSRETALGIATAASQSGLGANAATSTYEGAERPTTEHPILSRPAILDPDISLGEAKRWLVDQPEGAACPCCTQMAKVYRRKIDSTTASALITVYRAAEQDWVHLPTVLNRKQADEAKARYWGLLEADDGERSDGSNRTGWWRLTDAGVGYVLGRASVPKYVLIYDGVSLGLEGDLVNIRDALGTDFNYEDLMAGR